MERDRAVEQIDWSPCDAVRPLRRDTGFRLASLYPHLSPGLSDDFFNNFSRNIAVKRLKGETPGCVPKDDLCGDTDFPESFSMKVKTGEAVGSVLDEGSPITLVAKLSFH